MGARLGKSFNDHGQVYFNASDYGQVVGYHYDKNGFLQATVQWLRTSLITTFRAKPVGRVHELVGLPDECKTPCIPSGTLVDETVPTNACYLCYFVDTMLNITDVSVMNLNR